VLKAKPYLYPRFWFFGAPTFIVIISILSIFIAGSSGSFNSSPIVFLYSLVLFNLYIYLLMWGYMGVPERGFSVPNAIAEETPLKW